MALNDHRGRLPHHPLGPSARHTRAVRGHRAATVATNPRELGAQSDVLCVCVVDDSRRRRGAARIRRRTRRDGRRFGRRRAQHRRPADLPPAPGGLPGAAFHRRTGQRRWAQGGGGRAAGHGGRPCRRRRALPANLRDLRRPDRASRSRSAPARRPSCSTTSIFTAQLEIAAEAFDARCNERSSTSRRWRRFSHSAADAATRPTSSRAPASTSPRSDPWPDRCSRKTSASSLRHTGLSEGALRDAAEAAIRSMGAAPAGRTEGRP